MSDIEVAVVQQKSRDVIIVPLAPGFELRTPLEQNLTLNNVKDAARAASLEGDVIAIWQDRAGGRRYIAPAELDGFCQLLTMRWVRRHLNKRIEL